MYISNLRMHISSLEMKFISVFGNFSGGFRSFFCLLSLFFSRGRAWKAAGRVRFSGENPYLWLVILIQNLSLLLHVSNLQAFETCVTAL